MPTTPPADDRIHAALCQRVLGELARAIRCLGWRGARVHAGVHQARKSLRRIRSILRLGEAGLGAGAQVLEHELRATIHGLATMRDAQALVETLDRLIGERDADADERLLRRTRRIAADARANRTRAALADDPGFNFRRESLTVMADRIRALNWGAVNLEQVTAAVTASAKAARKAARRAQQSDDNRDWHKWRRRARRYAQQEHALVELGVLAATRVDDKNIAVMLGEAQDFTLLQEHCGAKSLFADKDRRALADLAHDRSRHLRRKISKALSDSYHDRAEGHPADDGDSLPAAPSN